MKKARKGFDVARLGSKAQSPHKRLALDMIPLRLQHPVPEAAILLGCGVRSVWRAIREKRLETVHLGSRIFISRIALEKYIAANTDTTGAPVRQAPPHIAAKVAAAAARAS